MVSNCVMCRLYERMRQAIGNGVYSVGVHKSIVQPRPVILGIGETMVIEVDANGALCTEVKPTENKREESN